MTDQISFTFVYFGHKIHKVCAIIGFGPYNFFIYSNKIWILSGPILSQVYKIITFLDSQTLVALDLQVWMELATHRKYTQSIWGKLCRRNCPTIAPALKVTLTIVKKCKVQNRCIFQPAFGDAHSKCWSKSAVSKVLVQKSWKGRKQGN